MPEVSLRLLAPHFAVFVQHAIHNNAKASIIESGLFEGRSPEDIRMVAEMVAYGDSGAYLDKARVWRGV